LWNLLQLVVLPVIPDGTRLPPQINELELPRPKLSRSAIFDELRYMSALFVITPPCEIKHPSRRNLRRKRGVGFPAHKLPMRFGSSADGRCHNRLPNES